jgi:phosphoglycolate phosphatase-like HAD superfamily hydrolase
MIGDSETDVLAGQEAGCRTALIGTVPKSCEPDLLAPSLDAASALIIRERRSET